MGVHRAGKEKFDVRRAPLVNQDHSEEHSCIEMGPLDDIPLCGSLSSLLFDPLDITADEESPLIQELRTIEGFSSLCFAGGRRQSQGSIQSLKPRAERQRRKTSHRIKNIVHQRALALRDIPPPGIELVIPKKSIPLSTLERASSAKSIATELSVNCGDLRELDLQVLNRHGSGLTELCGVCAPARSSKGDLLQNSLAETSVGPEGYLADLSVELPSHELPSLGPSGPSLELLTAGPSLMTDAGESSMSWDLHSHSHSHSHLHCCHGVHSHQQSLVFDDGLHRIQEGKPLEGKVTQRAPVVAVLEIPRAPVDNFEEDVRPRKRILRVQPAPDHVCLAFDPLETERERQELAHQVSRLMHPRTKRLVADIHDAGKFPRRQICKLPPRMGSARLAMANVTPTSSTAFSARASTRREREAMLEQGDGLAGEPGLTLPPVPTFPSDWHLMAAEGNLQNVGDRMRSYFPASARAEL